MRSRLAALAATTLAAAGLLAACGGEAESVTRTITTDQLPTTAPATTEAPTVPTTAPATTTSAGVDESRLPPEGSIPDTQAGTSRSLDDAQEFVDALYQVGDPSKPAAQSRLESAGYSGGILRDEIGSDPENGIALFRTYAIALRDDAAAQQEVDDAADEVESSSSAPSIPIEVPEIPGARGLRLDLSQAGATGSVAFVTFASGPYVYGLQGVSTRGETLPQDGLVEAARQLYARVSTQP
jgi:hypothetical protein